MGSKIEISQEFFKKVLLEKLKVIDEKLTKVDAMTYGSTEMHDIWFLIRESNLALEEIIDGIE